MFSKITSFAALTLLAVAEVSVALRAREGASWRRHQALARSGGAVDVSSRETNHTLEARAPGSRWTWYNTETGNRGSCGDFIKNSEFVVARAAVDMGNNRDCGKRITLSFQGRTAEAVIKDTCPGCPPNALDLSRDLFKFIAPNGDGVVHGDWWFSDGSGGGSTTTTSRPAPTTTTTRSTSSTTTSRSTTTTRSSTTSSTPPPTTTTTRSSSTTTRSSSTTTSTSTTTSSTSTSAAASATVSSSIQRQCRRRSKAKATATTAA